VELKKHIEELVDSELAMLGFELVKVEMSFVGRRKLLRVFIDREDRAVTIDDCVAVTKALGFVLDGEDIVPGSYNLEVSSPGIERPLTKPRHFMRFIGSRTRIEYRDASGAKATVIGEIAQADENSVSLSTDGEIMRIDYSDVVKANLKPGDIEIPRKARKKKKK